MRANILAIGYKDEAGQIIVTEVLCTRWPQMTRRQIAELSWRLDQWAARRMAASEDEEIQAKLVFENE